MLLNKMSLYSGSIFDTLVFLVIFTAATVGLEAKGALSEELLKVNSIDLFLIWV